MSFSSMLVMAGVALSCGYLTLKEMEILTDNDSYTGREWAYVSVLLCGEQVRSAAMWGLMNRAE